ncbi:transcriptional regulator [Massilia violaceinigra]|uniref:Transcriptional regulator n=1 Tax=Massilia violaceinigra TaxID=2045208 RepID=A0A2D2DGU3_9BURK|nr:transcriptional regulator [Massilia violaceinigra]
MKSIHDPRYLAFIEQLILERWSLKITQEQLSMVLGRPQSYVAKVENLDRRIDVVELRDWLMALNIEPTEFMCRIPWWSSNSASTEQ